MIEKRVKINNESGLHARCAATLAKKAMKFNCKIEISKGSTRASAKSIMGLMSLGLSSKTEVLIKAEGEEAEEAIKAISELFASGFCEL